MIVCDRFVFIHLHKSGGTFVNQLLLQCVPSARQIGYHLPYRELGQEHRALPVLGTVRNPWDYYVSWYFFQNAQPRPNLLFRLCSDDRRLSFSQTIRNLASLSSNPDRLSALRAGLPDEFATAGLNLTKRCLDPLRGRRIGFYSFLYERMYSGARAPLIVRTESLRTGIRDALSELGAAPNALVDLFLEHAPKMNSGRHEPYPTYFDDELRDLIGELDEPVITKHGYEF